jgi:predicted nucleotidyltransferase
MSQTSEERTETQPADADLLKQVVDLLLAVSHPRKIILFGSRARGTQRDDSDLDLLVVLDRVEHRRREVGRLRRALTPIKMPIDVLVYSEKDVQERGGWRGTALNEAIREGRVLYG